jgi:hypothetical protein
MSDKTDKISPALKYLAITLIVASLIFTSFVLCSCKQTIDYNETLSDNQFSATYQLLNGAHSVTIEVNNGVSLLISYNSVVESGELTIKLYDSSRTLVYEFPVGTTGIEIFQINRDDKYLLEVDGNDAKGSFDLQWLMND